SPNHAGQGHICYGEKVAVCTALWGWFSYSYASDQLSADNLVLWGIAVEVSRPKVWRWVRDIKKKGGKLIVVDPRRTESADIADIYLPVRPGTDCALALGMINIIIGEGLYDKEFVDKWCYGFESLRKRAEEYPVSKVAEITGLPARKIEAAARMYGRIKPWAIVQGMGTEELGNNAEFIHAQHILPAITGNINIPGGEVISGPHPKLITEAEMELQDLLPNEQKMKQLGSDRFKLFTWPGYDLIQENVRRVWGKNSGCAANQCLASAPLLYRAILTREPYPVRAVLTIASNPMVTQANTKLVYQALKMLDLYVVADFWMTPSAELADYVLPAASWMERPVLWTSNGNSNTIVGGEQALPASIPGEYDHRTDYEFLRGLGIRLGQEKYWPWKTLEEVYDYRLKPLGLTFKEFMAKGGRDFPPIEFSIHEKRGFGTPTGKIELYSVILEKLGYDPLPFYQEPAESPVSSPELAREYPLTLITRREMPFFHSEHRQIDSLRRRHPEPFVQIHPETAGELGIADGDWVWIETKLGKMRQKCQYFNGMGPDIVSAEHGWWFPELPGEEPWLHGVWESNLNVCVNDAPEILNTKLGSWPLRPSLCKVYKVKIYN
ncbi:molybdopterin-dependent oxidoreductase, partial [Thermodesulfobacteriota bacterium]